MEKSTASSVEKRCAVVTGGNKGVGFEICRQLASSGIRVVLTARDEGKGTEAVDVLKDSGFTDVAFHQLDVKDPSSIASLAKYIETNFKKLDILVNNAGIDGVIVDNEPYLEFQLGGVSVSIKITDDIVHLVNKFMEQTHEKAEECLRTNYYGAKGVTEALLPLLQLSNSARIVNVSSILGQLKFIYNEKVKEKLENVYSLTEDQIDEILQWFLRDFKEDKLQANGWPITLSAYKVSKAALNAYTRLIAREYPNILVNCVHPGYVKTDMTCNMGHLTPEEGARAPVMLALLPDDGPSGLYFSEMQESSF